MSKKTIYLTPTQVIEKYPELEGFGWSAKEIGMFLKSRLLDGYYNHSLRKSMIEEDSIGKLVDFANDLIETQKVKTVFPIKRESKIN
jgi:hypothetical protein